MKIETTIRKTPMTPQKWLITGGCGFIGTSLIKKLIKDGGHSIRVVDNLSVGTRKDLEAVCPFTEISPDQLTPHPSLIVGDILDESLALQVTRDVDIIVHLAANTGVGPSVEDPRADCMANVVGTFNYLDAARRNRVKRFIFASSGAPAGEVEPPIHEELPPHPVSPYGASKLAGEGYCSAFFKTFGVETIALRFGNVYGPGSLHKSSVVAKFIKQALAGQDLEIYGDGTQTRDFIYIDDLVTAIELAAATPGIGGEVFQIATHTETTVGEMAKMLVKTLAEKGIDNITIIHSHPRLGDVKRNYSDTSKARQVLAWEPQTDLTSGLARTVAYYLRNDP
jgi:UDP-glucose 4-epimerase